VFVFAETVLCAHHIALECNSEAKSKSTQQPTPAYPEEVIILAEAVLCVHHVAATH
jgi:hypothetical protein